VRETLVAVALGSTGCVLADPPPTLPTIAEHAPYVDTSEVVPSPGAFLTSWPTYFWVPVELFDPTQSVFWQMSVDATPFANAGTGGVDLTPLGGPLAPDGGDMVTLPVTYPAPLLAPGCHVIKLVVMFQVNGLPDTNPSDQSVLYWYFDPNGPSSLCGSYDAGSLNDGSLPDAGEAG
jgi:hypothetical protein